MHPIANQVRESIVKIYLVCLKVIKTIKKNLIKIEKKEEVDECESGNIKFYFI